MNSEAPTPLTPADCDLQDFAFMPLDVARLRDSDLASDESPEACWAAVLLWAASWHQVPAASIPDNDNWIAKQAGYAQRGKIAREWSGVRPGALRGWVKCSDGRLYHPVVAEKARDAWQAKMEQRWRTECGRIKKHNQRHKTNIPFPEFVAWTEAGRPQGQPLYVPGDEDQGNEDKTGDKASKRQGEGQGQGQGYVNQEQAAPLASTVGAAEKQQSAAPTRIGEICQLLRKSGINTSPAHMQTHAWVSNPAATDELITTAIDKARQNKPGGAIHPNYLKPIIEDLLKPPEAKQGKPPQDAWWLTNAGIERMGREMNMFARGTESHNDFKDRIFVEIRKRGGKTA